MGWGGQPRDARIKIVLTRHVGMAAAASALFGRAAQKSVIPL